MPTSTRFATLLSVAALVGGGLSTGCNPTRAMPGGHTDSGTHHMGSDVGVVSGCTSMADSDHNGIADSIEDPANPDDDGDTITDMVENMGAANPCAPSDCDHDSIPNFHDTDSDNDGVPDEQEATLGTDQCNPDSDGDGVTDLVEVAAGTDPRSSTSMPPPGTLYVTIPYNPPGTMGTHPHRQFDFSTRIQIADVFILVDNSASMGPVIAALAAAFSGTIVPGIRMQIPDVRIGVGSFDSLPAGPDGSPGDYTLWVRQRLDADATLSQTAFNNMHTIDTDTHNADFGGDYPEDHVEALFESIDGAGMVGHETDEAARATVHNGLTGDGYVPTMDPARDCGVAPDGPRPYGWACFNEGRVPILVLASDASWYNGPAPGSPSDGAQHSYGSLLATMQARGAFYIGVDIGDAGDTFRNSQLLATDSGTVDGAGAPVAFHPGSAGISGSLGNDIVAAVTTVAGETVQDITTRTDPDRTETRLPASHTTADFIRAVTPDHGVPDMPTGYTSKDATTFYHVNPATVVWFDVDFYNDFQMPTATAQLFRATIQVLGRAGSIVDHKDVYMIIPPTGGTIGPM